MSQELRRQLGADELDVVGLETESTAKKMQYPLDGAEGDEVGIARSKKHGKSLVLETEHGCGTRCDHNQHTEEHLAQHLKMIAKRHSAFFYTHDKLNTKKTLDK